MNKTILFLHSSSDLYGASKILLQTVDVWQRNGGKSIVILSENGLLVKELEKVGAEVLLFDLAILRRKYFNILGIINRLFTFVSVQIRMRSLIKSKKINIVYSNTVAVISGVFAAKISGIKHIYHIHEIIENPKVLKSFLDFVVCKLSDLNLVVSKAVLNNWNRNSSEKFRLLYNGIQFDKLKDFERDRFRESLGLKADEFVIGMIARVHYWKGQTYFLRIASQLLRKNNKLKFVMVGDAFPGYEYLYKEISDLINELGIASSIINLGFRTDVAQIMRALDLFILPSVLPDPLPTTVFEAMDAGLPVVGTNHGGVVEMIENGKSGILIPFDDPTEAAELIQKLINRPEALKLMGDEAFSRVKTVFSKGAYEEGILEIFQDFMRKNG